MAHLINLRRHRWAIVAALIMGLLFLGRWALQSHNVAIAPAAVERAIPAEPVADNTPPQAVPEPASDVPPPAPEDARASAAFRGRVIDAVTRKPVPQFTVALERNGSTRPEKPPQPRSFHAEDGRFEWQQAPLGEWTVTTTAHGYQRFQLDAVRIANGEPAPEVVMLLRPGYTLQGRVYDEVTGVGIAAARIGFREAGVGRFEGNWRDRIHVTTQKDGSFVADGLPGGRLTLQVSAEDYSGRELDVAVEESSPPLAIGLASGGTIAGHLAAADGVTPIAGRAALWQLDQGQGGMSRTGDAGEFSFQHLPAGRYRLSGASADGSAEREIVLAGNQRIEGIVLAMGRGGSIRGAVTGVKPGRLASVSVSVRRGNEAGPDGSEVPVDATGAYEIRGVKPGRLQVVADVSSSRQMLKTIDMPEGSDVTVNFDFPRGSRLSGRVTRNGKPVAGVWLDTRPLQKQEEIHVYGGGSTAANGEYAVEDLPAGEYYVLVDDYRSRTVQLSGDTVFNIDIPSAHLSGRVVEEGGRVPVVGADVDVWPTQPDSPRLRLHGDSNDLGEFALTGMEPGEFMLTAYKPGYEMYRERIAYDAPVTAMLIRLRLAKGVEIRAHEAGTGKSLQSLIVIEMTGEKNGSRLQLHLDENGTGSLPSALAGSTLSFIAHGHVPALVRDWDGQTLDLQLAAGGPR